MAFEFGSPGMAQSSMRGKSVSRGGSTRTVLKILIMWTVFGSSVTNFHISPRQGPWRREGKNTLANHWLQVRAPMQLVRTRATMSKDAAWVTLGLEPGASEEDVEKTYKQLVKKYHPDTKITGDANMLQKIVKAKLIIKSSFKSGGAVEKRMSKPKSHRDPFADDEEDVRDVDPRRNYRADQYYVKYWDTERERYYYVNQATRESSWKEPKGRCLIGRVKHEKEIAERLKKKRKKYEGGHVLRDVFRWRFGHFAGLREMGMQEGANDIEQEQCERFCDWLEEKAEPKFWRRVLRNRTYGCVRLCEAPLEVLQDRYKDRNEILEGMEQQQRLQMTKGQRVIGIIAYDKNISEAQCNDIVDLLLHHDSSKRYWREQLVQYPHGFVHLCSLSVERMQLDKLTKEKIVHFMSTRNNEIANEEPHELRSLMRKHFIDVNAETRYEQRRMKEEQKAGSIASALRSRLNMVNGLKKIDEMAAAVSGATTLSQAESEVVCQMLLQCAKTDYARKRLKKELKTHPHGTVKLFVTPAEQLRNICESLKAIVKFLRENEGPPGL